MRTLGQGVKKVAKARRAFLRAIDEAEKKMTWQQNEAARLEAIKKLGNWSSQADAAATQMMAAEQQLLGTLPPGTKVSRLQDCLVVENINVRGVTKRAVTIDDANEGFHGIEEEAKKTPP